MLETKTLAVAANGHSHALRPLGHGGMGCVYETHDAEHGIVAIKFACESPPRKLACLRNEYEQMARVRHPNVARVHGLRDTDVGPALILERVHGTSFDVWLRGDELEHGRSAVQDTVTAEVARSASAEAVRLYLPTRSADEVARAFLQLAQAVSHLHELGMLHCDLKPSNVMIEDAGRVVLIDFGLVTPIERAEPMRDMGTLQYWSPECLRGAAASTASDWYAFGLMLHEALTGWVPLANEFRRAGVVPPAVCIAHPEANPALARLCDALLRDVPGERPTAAQVLHALRRFANSRRGRALRGSTMHAEDGLLKPLRRWTSCARSGLRCARRSPRGVRGTRSLRPSPPRRALVASRSRR